MSKIKRAIAILFVSACLLLSGCSTVSTLDSTEPTTIFDLHEENISVSLFRKAPTLLVIVTDDNGRFNLSVNLRTSGNVSDFGIYVLEVQAAFENEFAEEERGYFSVNLPIAGADSAMIRFSSDNYAESTSSLSGTIYDNRSGELITHDIADVDALCELFPATSAHISKSAIDPDDLSIYEEVMEILNDQMDRPEDEILEEIAPDYGMTAEELKQFLRNTMAQIYGGGSTISTYPLNVEDVYWDYAVSIPKIIYTTPASENGLAGNIYVFEGTVVDIISYGDETSTFDAAIVETEGGKVMVTNLYKEIYDSMVETVGESDTKSFLTDDASNYILPEVGEIARFIAIYDGYSGTYEMPYFYLGASSCLLDLLEYDDPVNPK